MLILTPCFSAVAAVIPTTEPNQEGSDNNTNNGGDDANPQQGLVLRIALKACWFSDYTERPNQNTGKWHATHHQAHAHPRRSTQEGGVRRRQRVRNVALNVSILNLSRELRIGLAAEVSYCRIK